MCARRRFRRKMGCWYVHTHTHQYFTYKVNLQKLFYNSMLDEQQWGRLVGGGGGYCSYMVMMVVVNSKTLLFRQLSNPHHHLPALSNLHVIFEG